IGSRRGRAPRRDAAIQLVLHLTAQARSRARRPVGWQPTRAMLRLLALLACASASIGGNDVTACTRAPDPVACVASAGTTIRRNVTTIARRLRRAAGRKVRIVGTTYPDVILGAWVDGNATSQSLARLSVVAFQSLINPTLREAYASAGARFVDVTAASGAYIPFDQVTTLFPYGTVPVAVARVCELTYFCAYRDIPARTDGYRLIANLVARQLPRRR